MEKKQNRYLQIIASIFDKHYQRGATEIDFTRDEIVAAAQRLKIVLPKNLGDVLYSFRYRAELLHGGRFDRLVCLRARRRIGKVIDEKHYRLVRPEALSAQELLAYQGRQA